MKTKNVLLIFASLLFSSCATIFCGSKKNIVLESNIPTAENVTVDNYTYHNVAFPFHVKIKRGFSETIIKCETKDYKPIEISINKEFNPVSIINLGSLVGWGIDAATGAITKPEYNSYNLDFEPIK